MTRSPRSLALLAGGLVILGAAGFAAVYFTLFNGSSAAPLGLSSGRSAGTSNGYASVLSGTWSVAPGSVAGYRVREMLAMLPAKSDAVGRTQDIAGTLSLSRNGSTIVIRAASFAVNVRTLKSDRSMRDAQIHRIGLQSNQYPTAGFRLTKPISLPAGAANEKTIDTSATGLLTIHGTTREVTIPLRGRIQANLIETAGSLTFPFSEFGMQAPSIGGFVSVESNATLEFDLRFQRGVTTQETATARSIAALKPVSGASAGGFPGSSLTGGPGGGQGPPGTPPSGSGPTP